MDILPLNVVEKPGFKMLMSSLAPQLELRCRTFFTKLLEKKFYERQAQLKAALRNSTDAATTLDAWTCRRRSYLGETIQWFDQKSLKRRNACLGCRRITGRHTYDVLAKLIESIHDEFEIKDKLRGSTTDNGSNFIKCFRENGAKSSLPTYEAQMNAVREENQQFSDDEEESEEEMHYFVLGDLLTELSDTNNNNENATLPMHRRCACHLLSLISKADVLKIQDRFFEQLRTSVFEKLQKLWNKQSASSLNSDLIMRHLGKLLIQKNDTRWNSEYDAVCCFVRLLQEKYREMKKLFAELKLEFITPIEEQFLKEYVIVMKPVSKCLDILQADKNVGMGFLLPTISFLKIKLKSLKENETIIHCQPLITSLLDAIHFR